MIKATINYSDGTEAVVKKKNYIELAAFMEKEREKGAIGFRSTSSAWTHTPCCTGFGFRTG